MKSLFEKMIGAKVPCDYARDDEGIVHIGERRDIAAYAGGDFKGKCIVFLHGNGETAVSEKYLFDQLNERGVSVVSPDYRGYGLTTGAFSEMDTIIPISHGERVFAGLASSQKEFVRVGHGQHNTFQFVMGYDKYVERIVRFCKNCG